MASRPDFPTLFDAARDGDTDARADLLAAYLPQLHAFVRLRMGSALRRREESMDLVQTVWVEVRRLRDPDDAEAGHEAVR